MQKGPVKSSHKYKQYTTTLGHWIDIAKRLAVFESNVSRTMVGGN